MKSIIWGVIILLLLPSAFAICDKVENKELCEQIFNSDLSQEYLNELVADMIYYGHNFPNHNVISDWNRVIEFTDPPVGVGSIDKRFIKNAWMKIVNVNPSVKIGENLYTIKHPRLIVGYNYDLEIPPNYYSRGYPERNNGDCKTTYSLISQNDAFDKNGLKAEYGVNAKVQVKHYKWRRYCCDRWDGECVEYCRKCSYRSTENVNENVVIKDEVEASVLPSELDYSFSIVDSYHGTTKGKLNAENYTNLKLSFKNSEYVHSKYSFSAEASLSPYYVLQLKAEPKEINKIDNMFFSNNSFYVADDSDCKLVVSDFFRTIEEDCDMTLYEEKVTKFIAKEFEKDKLMFFLKLIVFFIICWLIYSAMVGATKKYRF